VQHAKLGVGGGDIGKTHFDAKGGSANPSGLAACQNFQPRLRIAVALSKAACGGMLSTTPHQSQTNVCNGDCAPKLGLVRLNRMARPQNGQYGCGASVSIGLVVGPRWLTESKRDRPKAGILDVPLGSALVTESFLIAIAVLFDSCMLARSSQLKMP